MLEVLFVDKVSPLDMNGNVAVNNLLEQQHAYAKIQRDSYDVY